jgi:hypothetical protein
MGSGIASRVKRRYVLPAPPYSLLLLWCDLPKVDFVSARLDQGMPLLQIIEEVYPLPPLLRLRLPPLMP